MQGENRERWQLITEQMVTEQDPKRFSELTRELLDLLAEKRSRLKTKRQSKEDLSQAAAKNRESS